MGWEDFLVGAASTLTAEFVSHLFRSICCMDKTTECQKRLTCQIRLARAIINGLPEGPTIKNNYLKEWVSDLIDAANEGDKALQSSTADAKALKSALTKLEELIKDAKTYFQVLKSEQSKEASNDSGMSAIRTVGKYFSEMFSIQEEPNDWVNCSVFGKRNDMDMSAIRKLQSEKLKEAWNDLYMCPFRGFEKYLPEKKALISAAADTSFHLPCYSFEDYDHLKKKRMFPEFSSGSTIWEMTRATASKKHRRFEDSPGKELQKNSFWPYDSTNMVLIHNGEHSINNSMKMKGKCPEGEFVEQTGYGEANIPALSCSPSNSYGGASNHTPPSFDDIPEENDGCTGDVS